MTQVSNTATRRLGPIAAAQEGLVTTAQLRAAGLHDAVISRWVDSGRLHPVLRTVFALGRPAAGPRARLRAVVLACGPGTVISHRSAAWLLGLREVNPATVDVICPGQAGRKVDGIRVHVVPYPAPSEVRTAYGIPCTTVARTLVDLAGSSGNEQLRDAMAMAATLRVLDIAAVDGVLANGPRRRGAPALRTVLDEWRPVAETAKHSTIRSLFEAKLLPLVAAADLPIPKVNARVRTEERVLEVDLLWPTERLVVEADSRKHHAIEVAFEEDHKRTRELIAAGNEVLRVTWRELENEPDAVFAVLRARLVARGA
ncbi:MAG: type IV toxin-antitoxin system AbiEi family antitoxin domain-containing protein [Actinobacteria bacterium]|nr:type IV toxin-antitoxin system AbiEi family antitoxin domain-containing protein [Actinomycetota bacterium]